MAKPAATPFELIPTESPPYLLNHAGEDHPAVVQPPEGYVWPPDGQPGDPPLPIEEAYAGDA
jgi:hypothetical protein